MAPDARLTDLVFDEEFAACDVAEGLRRQHLQRRPLALGCPGRPSCALMAASLALLGLAASGALALKSRDRAGMYKAAVTEVSSFSKLPDDYCSQSLYLDFATPNAVLYSNLGNRGPAKGNPEGIEFLAECRGRGAGSEWDREVVVTANATNRNYVPYRPGKNGVVGHFGTINVMPGSHVDLVFRFYDAKTLERLTLPEVAFTFFDLDEAHEGTSKESVTLHDIKDYHLSGDDTEVVVEKVDGEHTKFSSSHFGIAADNPQHPLFLTAKQRRRSFTVRFEQLSQLTMTFAVGEGRGGGEGEEGEQGEEGEGEADGEGEGDGTEPREILFALRPALLCGKEVEEGYRPPLEDIVAIPPMQVAIEVDDGESFHSYRVEEGQKVDAGNMVVLTTRSDGSEHTYTAPASGHVFAVQHMLRPGDELDVRLANRVIVVVKKDYLDPLDTSEHGVVGGGPGTMEPLPDDTFFVRYLKKVGDRVSRKEHIAEAKDSEGSLIPILSTEAGVVKERQEDLEEGDPIMKVRDKELMTLSRFPRLPTNDENFKAAVVQRDLLEKKPIFEKFLVEVGEAIKEGDAICVIKDVATHMFHKIRASRSGMVTALQDVMKATLLSGYKTTTSPQSESSLPCPLTRIPSGPWTTRAVTSSSSRTKWRLGTWWRRVPTSHGFPPRMARRRRSGPLTRRE